MASYYVDATLGDDSNPGTQTQPWKTISKVNSTSFSAGDNIYFKRGEVWRETLTVPSSGSNGNLITFGAYGNGDKPKITGADIETGWTGPDENGVWQISGDSRHYRILLEDGQKLQKISPTDGSDLSSGQWGGDDSSYIYYKPSSGTPNDHIVELGTRKRALYINGKSYIKIENIRFEAGNGFEPPHDPDSLYLRSVVVLEDSSSCEIFNCEVLYGAYLGISLNGCTDCVINSNELTYIEDRAINIGADCSDITVASNYIHHIGKKASIRNGQNGEDKEGIVISSHGSEGSQEPSNITIEHNIIHDIGCDYSDKSTRAKGIVVCSEGADSGNITDIIIRYNKIYNCDGRGVSLEYVDGDHEVYYNIIFNNGIGNKESSVQWGGLIIHTRGGTTSSVKVYNNIFWKNSGTGAGSKANVNISTQSDSTLSLFLKNNVIGLFQNSEGFDLYYYPRDGTLNFESDYNLFYEDSGDKNCISYYSEYDFAHVLGNQSSYYSYDHSQDSHSLCQNPLFIDADDYDFRLQSSSPCIDAGVNVGLTEDYEGNSVPWGTGVDIGAFEFRRTTSANIRFIYDNTDFDSAIITASSEASGFPVSNLQEQRRKKTWRSSSLTNQYISIDFGSSIYANCVVLINHNLTYDGRIKLVATDSSDYESNPKLYIRFWAWQSVWGFGEGGFGEHGFGGFPTPAEVNKLFPGVIRIYYFPTTEARYWRLYFEDNDNPDGYFELGRLFLTHYFEPSYNFVWDWKFIPQDRTRVKYTRGGQPITYILEKQYKVSFTFEWIEKDEAWTYFVDIVRRFGIRKDIVIDMFPDETKVKGVLTRLYGRFEDVPELINKIRRNVISLNFIESL